MTHQFHSFSLYFIAGEWLEDRDLLISGHGIVIREGHHLKATWQPVPWWMSKSHKGGGQQEVKVKVLVTQSQCCLTLCNPMDCRLPGSSVHGILRQAHWNGLPFPSPGHLPDPGTEPRSPTLQADSLPSEPLGKPFQQESHVKWIASSSLCSNLTFPKHPFKLKFSCFVSFPSSTYLYNLHGFFFSSTLMTFNLFYNLFLLSISISGQMLSALITCSLNYPQSMA